MAKFIPFTAQQKEQARRTDLVALLESLGETLRRSGSEYEWKDGSAKVTIRGNLWYHQYDQEGGDAIEFVKRFMEKSYPEAVEYLLGGGASTLVVSEPVQKQKEKTEFELPKRHFNMYRALAYLHQTRKIDKEVLSAFIKKKLIYESDKYSNAVFVGYDTDGVARHASVRGTGSRSTYRGNVSGSIPEYSFHWNGQSDCLYAFEAPIDMLSFISLHKENWAHHNYAACCGVGDRVIFQMLKDNPKIKTVCLCLDNDDKGQAANLRIAAKLKEKGVAVKILVPVHKDWNEDLSSPQEQEEQEETEEGEPCRVLSF